MFSGGVDYMFLQPNLALDADVPFAPAGKFFFFL
jgi:hypothetical protein